MAKTLFDTVINNVQARINKEGYAYSKNKIHEDIVQKIRTTQEFWQSFAQVNEEGYAYSKDNNILELIVYNIRTTHEFRARFRTRNEDATIC